MQESNLILSAVGFFLLAPFLLVGSSPEDQKALDLIESRLIQEPSNPRLWAGRGVALSRLGRDKESVESFDKSLAISPKFLSALEGAAEVTYRIGDARASGYISRILGQDSRNATAHAMAGAIAFESRDCRASVDHLSAAGSTVAPNPLALAQWGECLITLDQAGPAVRKLRDSLALNPTDPRVPYNLALALHLSGQQEEALHVLQRVPSDAGALNLQASIYVAQRRFSDAVATFRKAMELAPKDERSYIDLASLCLDHQSFDVAYDVVNAGIASIPASAALYTLRGAIAAQGSKIEESAADFERASRLQPNQIYSDAGLSLLLEQKDEIDKAIAVIRPRLKALPNDAVLNFLLAELILKSPNLDRRQQEEARSLLGNAIRLKPDFGKAHSVLGKLELQQSETDSGVRELQTALQYDPADRIALNQLVLGLRKLGRTNEAGVVANQLRDLLSEGRREEVRKNSVRFVRLSSQRH